MKYSAVIVTKDRLNLLKLALDKLLEQTYPLDSIVVVDNVSTDGTVEYLKSVESDKIIVIYNDKNEGGAGGFYKGIKKAYEIGSDYMWIMDDDTIVTKNALEKLIDAFHVLREREVGFITSNVLYKDNKPCLMNISHCEYVWNEFIEHNLVRVTHSSFVAMMIKREVVRRLGLPFKEFFIWGDDGEYSTRIASQYEGYICGDSNVYHYMNENKGVDIFNTPAERISRFFYFYRNWMFTNKFRGQAAAAKFIKETKNLITNIKKSNTTNKKEKIKTIKQGLREGKKVNWEIDFVDGRPSQKGIINEKISIRVKNVLIDKLKKLLLKFDGKFNGAFTFTKKQYNLYKRLEHSKFEKLSFILKGFASAKVYNDSDRTVAFNKLMRNVKLDGTLNNRFFGSIDIFKCWELRNRQMDNSPSDYSLFIENSLLDLKIEDANNNMFVNETNSIIDSVILYVNRVIKYLKRSNFRNKKECIKWLNDFIYKPAQSIEDALQRIILINQLLWQTGHRLVGYGRLDYILDNLLKKDKIDKNELVAIISDFLKMQHNYYNFKSDALVGDTGQIIILGGLNEDGTYFYNNITYAFIEAIEKLQLPDPKILLRVSDNTNKNLYQKAVKCAASGIGNPLFSNDARVIPALLQYGYEKADAFNYTTSACWEPIPGNCNEQNNIQLINFTAPFELISQKDDLDSIKSFDEFLWYYCIHLKGHALFIVKLLDNIIWDKDPLMSAFSKSCRLNKCEISQGGSKYNNYGILSIGIGNAVNSLLNLKKYVFDEKIFNLKDLNNMRLENYYNNENVNSLLKLSAKNFGTDEEQVIKLTNYITKEVNEELNKYSNVFGGRVKFGLSSPSYLTIGKLSPATFDGRRANEPYSVHISADNGSAYTELMMFASKLEYNGARFNGNVVDLMVTRDFIKNNEIKFVDFIISSLKAGVFQLQMNIVSSKILIEAKNNPKTFPNLIVRVWGFSAYFNELPEEYKDMLINRAVENENSHF